MGKNEEYDVKKEVWQCYKIMYRTNFERDFIIDEKHKRRSIDEAFMIGKRVSKKIKFSGETDFNFKCGFSHSIYPRYEKFIINAKNFDKESITKYCKQLEICKKRVHSIVNISLMPQTGGLQLIKAGLGNDRLDRFVWAIHEYYEGNSNLLMSRASYENIDSLKSFLELFNTAVEYCKTMYHIDEALVEKLIKLGKVDIDSAERVVEYMDLAFEFWKQKVDFFYKQESLSEEIKNDLEKINIQLNTYLK